MSMRYFIAGLSFFWFGVPQLFAQVGRPVVNLGDTIAICQGNSIILDATNANSFYLWNTGATTPTITVNKAGLYSVRVTNGVGITRDSVRVLVDQPLSPNLGGTQYLCNQSSITLQVSASPRFTYLWSNGDKTPTTVVSQPGNYWVDITNACGTYRATVSVQSGFFARPFSLGPDIVECRDSTVNLKGPPGIRGSLLWNTGATSSGTTVSSSGTYWLTVTTPCDSYTDTVKVTFPNKQQLGFPDTVRYCHDSSFRIGTTLPGPYLWNDGSTAATRTISTPGIHWLRIRNACGFLYDSVYAMPRFPPQFNLGPDTLEICAPINLIAKEGTSYLWSTGSRANGVLANQTGWYWVRATNRCGTSYDSIYIRLKPSPTLNWPSPYYVSFCDSTPVMVDATNNGAGFRYQWSNGDTTAIASYRDSGQAWVRIMHDCDTIIRRFTVIKDRHLQLDIPDTTVCNMVRHTLPFNLWPTDSLIWSNGSHLASRAFTSSGPYWVKIFNACDTLVDTFQVNVVPALPPPPPTTHKCFDDSVAVTIPLSGNAQGYWLHDSTLPQTIWVKQPGVFQAVQKSMCDSNLINIEVANDTLLDLDLGPDSILCHPQSLSIPLDRSGSNEYFLNGKRYHGPNLILDTTGHFVLEALNSCGRFKDSVQLQVRFRPQTSLADTVGMCRGSTAILNARSRHADSYLWSTGSTDSAVSLSQPGWYWVQLTNDCFTEVDSVYLIEQDPMPGAIFHSDTLYTCNFPYNLQADYQPGVFYQWRSGANSRTRRINRKGWYYLTVTNACHSITDSVYVQKTGKPKTVLGNQVNFCASNAIVLNAQNRGSTYLWSTGDTTRTITVKKEATYWVRITNDCGSVLDSIQARPNLPLFERLDLGADTVLCMGALLVLDPLTGKYSSTEWSTGSLDSTLVVSESGQYVIRVENLCGTFLDTINVKFIFPPLFDIPDQGICYQNDRLTVYAPPRSSLGIPQGVSFLWSTGSTRDRVTLTEPGVYWLQATNGCTSHTDTFTVAPQRPVAFDLSADVQACENDSVLVDLKHIPHPVQWPDGVVSNYRYIGERGSYVLKTANRCGTYFDTLRVGLHEDLSDTVLNPAFCRGDSLVLDFRDKPYQYRWWDGSTAKRRSFRDSGRYAVSITNLCGLSERTYDLQPQLCDCPVHMPTAFTPNSDGLNDTYGPVTLCNFSDYQLLIYDRWGKLLYQTRRLEDWDGQSAGTAVPAGVYLYRLRYRWMIGNHQAEAEKKGHFSLLR